MRAVAVSAALAFVCCVLLAAVGGRPDGAVLDAPAAYDESWGIAPESEDAPEFQVGFNAGDVDGESWRQYVPLAVWGDQEWYDEAGNYQVSVIVTD